MIKTISIQNYKSFHPSVPVVINLDTGNRTTFFYGLNGAGKSAIGEVIHGRTVQDARFAQCRVETTGTGPFRHLVYNHEFVNRVIAETMQGIFTIGEVDTGKQREIEETEAENAALEMDLKSRQEQAQVSGKLIEAQLKRAIDDVWKAHTSAKETKLDHFLVGYGRNKNGFFDDLRNFAVAEGTPVDTIARLEQRWEDASGSETGKSVPQIDLSDLAAIEADSIWGEPIEMSASSRLAPMIAKLGNGDWVDQGRPHIQDQHCPFCQQGLPHDFELELAKLLDGNRKQKIDRISLLLSNYFLHLKQLQGRMLGVLDDPITNDTGLELAWARLEGQLQANISHMQGKQSKPSEAVSLVGTDGQAVLDALAQLKEKVNDFNQRALDRSSERTKIRTMFYQALWLNRREAYSSHDAALEPLQTQLTEQEGSAQKVTDRIAANVVRLKELRTQQTGVDASVEAINTALKDLGVSSFWINKKQNVGSLYCLARPGETDCSARSLSEGEKTLISFLYFIELIKGSHEEARAVEIEKTVVVIDDPISSLSHNFIYDVASIIQHQLIKPPQDARTVRQVIVLTHNLFFFHELVRQAAGKKLTTAANRCQMLRVQKNEHSTVLPLNPLDFLNDYDALWQVLREARDGRAPIQVVPNTMRCILEQFFSFTGASEDFGKALEQLGSADMSNRFSALQRYLDRGSHKDGINGPPIDWSQYDTVYYLGKLRAALREAGHEHHYLRKMGEEQQTQVAA